MPQTPPINWNVPKLSAAQADGLVFGLTIAFTIGLFTCWALQQWPILGLSFFVALSLMMYAGFMEPRRLTVTQWKVPFPLSKPLRVAVAADLHVGPFKQADWVEKVVQKLCSLKPDLILLPGDFLFDESADINFLDPLKKLSAPLGVYAVSGNHDAGHYFDQHGFFTKGDRVNELERYLKERGITMLRNAHVVLEHEGEKLALAGIDDLWGPSCDINNAFEGIPADMPVLLQTHHPDTVLDERSMRADLMVCGHTHGGQVRFPIIGPLAVPSVTGKKYAYGLFEMKNGTTRLFTSRGCGETLLRVRFNCPPEIAVLELDRE